MRHAWFALLIAIQFFGVLAMAFLPFGFDKQSALGLDYAHFLLIALCYVVAALTGAGMAIAKKEWLWLGAQLLLAGIAIAAVIFNSP